MTEENQKETLEFLSAHGLPYVCVDEPQGYPNSIPPVLAVTSDLAVVRLHGHSDQWESRDIQERFRYRYSDDELRMWAGNVERLAEDADETHVVFNNCYRDYAHVNAGQLAGLISQRLVVPGELLPVGLALFQERVPALGRLVGHVREPGGLAGEELLAHQAVVDGVEGVFQHPL